MQSLTSYRRPKGKASGNQINVALVAELTCFLNLRCRLFNGDFTMENRRMAEGVGFEPTVGFPTLDFESSALNRTQPPFLEAKENAERRQRPTSRRPTQTSRRHPVGEGRLLRRWDVGCSHCEFFHELAPTCLADRIFALRGKKCYN